MAALVRADDLEGATAVSTTRARLIARFWPQGPVCPACGERERLADRLDGWRCAACRRDFSLRHGTIMAGSRLPLIVWARAIALLESEPRITSVRAAGLLGIDQPQAAGLIQRLTPGLRGQFTP